MMHIATVSSKNQITLPTTMLGMMGVKPGDRLMLEMDNNRFVAQKSKINSIVEQLSGSLNKFVSPKLLSADPDLILTKIKSKMAKEWATND